MIKSQHGLKSQRLSYYDFDKGRHIRKFSLIEISHTHKIFDTISSILSENKITIRNKSMSCGRCRCGTHNDTYFIVEILSSMAEPGAISEIEDALTELNVKLIRIVARQEKGQTYIVLVILQLPYL